MNVHDFENNIQFFQCLSIHQETECTKKNTLLGIWAFRKNGQWQPYRINDNFKHACTLLIKGKIL